jgi:hypothetical protein
VSGALTQPRIQPPAAPPPPAGPAVPGGAPGLLKGVTLEQTLAMLKEAGYTDVEIYTAKSGRKHVSGKIQGMLVGALHQHCNESYVCPALSFSTFFGQQETIDAAYMNAWNRQKLYARLFKETNGDLYLQQDVLVHEVPLIYIKHAAQMYGYLIRDLLQFKPSAN